jgi:CheY-like chemotaxis protein
VDTTSPRSVLVVDDNKDMVGSMTALLELSGYRVHSASDGVTAVEAALRTRPDYILLDIGLPKMDGIEVAKRLRRERSLDETKIIAITAYGTDEDRRRTREAGCDAHYLKPIEPGTLDAMLAGRVRRT